MKPLHSLLLSLTILSLGACGIKKPSTPTPSAGTTPPTEHAVRSLQDRLATYIQAPPAYASVLRGNLQAELRLGKEQVSTKINATIKQGELIYWSVVPFPLIEAARVWFTQQGITAVDRMHGRYAEVSYDELSALLGFPIQYQEVEQLLLGKAFVPADARGLRGGAYSVTAADDASAEISALLPVAQGSAKGKYLLNWHLTPELHPTRFTVHHQDGVQKPIFSLNYRQDEASIAKAIPQETALFLGSSSSPLPALRLDWSKVRPYTGTLPDLTPRIKDSYQRMTLPELLKLLSAL